MKHLEASMELVKPTPARSDKTGVVGIPIPEDAPLLTLAEAGAYLRLSAASVRKLVDGRADSKNDELGTRLRAWVVRLSPHRRYIRRDLFMGWLSGLTKGA